MSEPRRPAGARRLFRLPWRTPRHLAEDVEDELQFHIEHVAAELRAAGWSDAEARSEAVRRFGDLEYTRTYCRTEDLRREQESRRMTFIDELRQDLKYALRSLRSSPAFAAAAIITLTLGIGANTAIFSAVRGVLLEPLPFRDADRIVRVWHAHPANGIERGRVSEPDFIDWRSESRTAESMGGFFFLDGLTGLDLTGAGDPQRLLGAFVTDGFFQTLGTPAALGLTLGPDDHIDGRNRMVVFSHGLWTRSFGADRGVIGASVNLNGEPFQVVGVMPPGFTYPADETIDAWIPVSFFGPDDIGRSRNARFLSVIARLAPGANESQLGAELSGVAARLAQEHPQNAGWDVATTLPIRESILGDVRGPLLVLMAAVAMLLLIACVNIAGLLLARATGRQRELAVRAALGAGRWRIARQLLTESLTLALLGGAFGILLGIAGVRGLVAAGASEFPRAGDIRVDGFVLAFTAALAMVAGLAFGLMPALRASGNLEQSLRSGGRGAVGGTGQRLRSGLVVAEVALALLLVVGAGLATKSFARLMSVDPGFRPTGALVTTMSVPSARLGTIDAMAGYYYAVLDAIRAIPGVQAAGAIRDLPLRGLGEMRHPEVPGRPTPPGGNPAVQLHHVSTDFFRAIGTPLRSGRTFELGDRASMPLVTVVNEELARRAWPGEDAVGKALRFGNTDVRVIGVVADIRQGGLAEPVEPTMYLPVLQQFRSAMSIVVRVNGDPLQYAGPVRQAIWSHDPTQTITSMTTLDAVVGRAVARPRLLAWLLALFGAIGLTLGALGIFGVLAYSVGQRRQEIGVRVALGAPPRAVLGSIIGHGMLLAGVGVLIGIAGAVLATRSMQSVLFGIEPTDPGTFAQVTLILLGAAFLASWLPARRALAIDPVTALRYD